MALDLKALAETIFFSENAKLAKYHNVFTGETTLIYELRGKTWNPACRHVMGLGQRDRSKCVVVYIKEDSCMLSVPDCGGCFPSSNDEIVSILIDMVK